MTERFIEVLEPVEIDNQQGTGSLGIAIGLEHLRQPKIGALAVRQARHGIELREPFGIALAFARLGNVLRTSAIADEFVMGVELRLAGDFPPDLASFDSQAHVELADRIARAQEEGQRAFGAIGIIGLFGDEQFTQ